MNHRTRIEAAINRRPVDQIPCAELVINDGLIQAMFGKAPLAFEHRLEFVRTMGLDAVCLHPRRHNDIPAAQEISFDDLQAWVNTDLFSFAVLDGVMGWGSRLLSFEQLMTKLVCGHSDFQELLAAVERLNLSLMEQLAANGVNGIIIADDIAFSQGLFVRPAVLRKTVFASLIRQVEQAKKLNLPVFFHSDGNLTLVLEDIVAAGFDGLQCIEKMAGMDIGAIKRQYGHKLCLWGNLDPAELIEERSRDELEEAAGSVVKATEGSGLIFGTSSGLFENMRLDSLTAIYQFVRERKHS